MRSLLKSMLLILALAGYGRNAKVQDEEQVRDPRYAELVAKLVHASAAISVAESTERNPEWLASLRKLAEENGWKEELEACERKSIDFWDDGDYRAVAFRHGTDHFVIICAKSWTHCTPGEDVQTLFLIDESGPLLDSLSCTVNSRLTHMWWGKLYVDMPEEPNADQARIIVRLVLKDSFPISGNFSHQIDFRGHSHDYYWGGHLSDDGQPTVWDRKGLCRLSVDQGKFKVIFPSVDKQP